jgi:hypothetical protein
MMLKDEKETIKYILVYDVEKRMRGNGIRRYEIGRKRVYRAAIQDARVMSEAISRPTKKVE